jgi:hypothetical protein
MGKKAFGKKKRVPSTRKRAVDGKIVRQRSYYDRVALQP